MSTPRLAFTVVSAVALLVAAPSLTGCGGGVQGSKAATLPTLDEDQDGVPASEDCDDTDGAVLPGATEICNGKDDDCDGFVDTADDGLTDGELLYRDADGDGFGDPDHPELSCGDDAGLVGDTTDCDDVDADVHPGATEACTTLADDDCDGEANGEGSDGCIAFYGDLDADGYGGEQTLCLCLAEAPYTELSAEDCDDAVATVHPDAEELCGNGVDDDCDGTAAGCLYEGTLSLEAADARVVGVANSDRAGERLDSRGDLGGDGRGDLVLLAPGHAGVGAAALVEGAIGGELDLSSVDALRIGAAEAPLTDLAVVGDIDGDGYGDVALGSAGAEGGAGAVWLWTGPQEGGALLDLPWKLVGPLAGGADLAAAAGDLNGDGAADLVVGAPEKDAVYLISGPLGGGGSVEAIGHEVRGASGDLAAVVSLGDIDGDGLDDLAFGSPQRSSEGRLWVVYGPGTALSSLSDADAEINAVEAESELGASLAAVGDCNGDGLPDLLAGAPGLDQAGSDVGGAYLFYGPLSGVTDASVAAVTFAGEFTNDMAGAAVAGGGDVNADGALDFAFGAPGMDQAGTASGMTYLLYGPVAGAVELKFADAFFEGTERHEESGAALSLGADLGGDGYRDLLIGAPGNSDRGDDAGSVEVFFGAGL